jgi:hypothetical protein
MCIEIVYNEMPLPDLWVSFNGALDMSEKIGFIARWSSRNLSNPTPGDMEVDDKRQCSMSDILEFSPQDMSGLHRQIWMFRFTGLDSRHFIRTHNRLAPSHSFLGCLIQLINVGYFLIRLWIGFRVQIVAHQVWL